MVRPVIVCGPSGAGKGTLIQMLLERRPDLAALQVSHTSRPPRPGEAEGVHYYFSDLETMKAMNERQEFLEFCQVGERCYGSSIMSLDRIMESGKVPIMDIDIRGCLRLANHCRTKNAVFVWIDALNDEQLLQRLRKRGTETEEQILDRMVLGAEDRQKAIDSELFDENWIYNNDLELAYSLFEEIVQEARQG